MEQATDEPSCTRLFTFNQSIKCKINETKPRAIPVDSIEILPQEALKLNWDVSRWPKAEKNVAFFPFIYNFPDFSSSSLSVCSSQLQNSWAVNVCARRFVDSANFTFSCDHREIEKNMSFRFVVAYFVRSGHRQQVMEMLRAIVMDRERFADLIASNFNSSRLIPKSLIFTPSVICFLNASVVDIFIFQPQHPMETLVHHNNKSRIIFDRFLMFVKCWTRFNRGAFQHAISLTRV